MNHRLSGFGYSRVPILVVVAALVAQGCLFNEDYRVESSATLATGGNSNTAGTSYGGNGGVIGGTGANTSTSTACTGGSGWVSMAAPPLDFVARERAAVTAFDGKVFVFGGVDSFGTSLDTGAIYDSQTNSWEFLPNDTNTPDPRQAAAAVYVGGKILVWGGKTYSSSDNRYHMFSSGAAYDLQARRWSPIADAWESRAAPIAATDGTRAVFFGGFDSSFDTVSNGSLFNLSTGSWEWMSSDSSPGPASAATVVGTSNGLFVYGGELNGSGNTDHASTYDLGQNKWTAVPNGPSPRSGSFGAWDGSHVYVWGGIDGTGALNDGRLLARSWIEMAKPSPSNARWSAYEMSGWAFAIGTDDIAFVGGYDTQGEVQTDGLRYKRSPEAWSKIPAWPSGEQHVGAAAVWTAGEFFIFGGQDGKRLTSTGERWRACN